MFYRMEYVVFCPLSDMCWICLINGQITRFRNAAVHCLATCGEVV